MSVMAGKSVILQQTDQSISGKVGHGGEAQEPVKDFKTYFLVVEF